MSTLMQRRVLWHYDEVVGMPHAIVTSDGVEAHTNCAFDGDRFASLSDLVDSAAHDLLKQYNDAHDSPVQSFDVQCVVAMGNNALGLAQKIAEQLTELGGYEEDSIEIYIVAADESATDYSTLEDKNVVICTSEFNDDVEIVVKQFKAAVRGYGTQVFEDVFAVCNLLNRDKRPDNDAEANTGKPKKDAFNVISLVNLKRVVSCIVGTCQLCKAGSRALIFPGEHPELFFPSFSQQSVKVESSEVRQPKLTANNVPKSGTRPVAMTYKDSWRH